MSEPQTVKEKPSEEQEQQTQLPIEQPQYLYSDNYPQKSFYLQLMRYLENPNLIFKTCWALGTAVTVGLFLILVDMLRLHNVYKNTSSFDSLISALTDFSNLVNLMQIVINVSVVFCIVETVMLIICLYKNRNIIKYRSSIMFYAFLAIQLIYTLTQVSKINAVANTIKILKSGNLGSIFGSALTGEFSALDIFEKRNITLLIVCLVFLIALSVVLFLMIFKNRSIKFNQLDVSNTLKKLHMTNKQIKIAAISAGSVAAAVILILAGTYVYSTFIYKNKVDLMRYVTISYDKNSISGESTATVNYDWPTAYKNNIEIANFLNVAQFKLSKQSNLKNGDKIEVQAIIDPSVEKKDRIKIVGNICKTVKVTGLPEYAKSVNDISKSRLVQFEDEGKAAISKDYDSDNANTTISFDSLYSKTQNDRLKIAAVYKIHTVYTGFFSDTTYETDGYRTYTISNIIVDKNKNVLDDKLNTSTWEYIDSPDDMVTKGFTKIS